MTDEQAKPEQPATPEAEAPDAADVAPAEELSETARLQGEIESLKRERDELQNRCLRAMADYQNMARRAEISIAAARDQQLMDVARSLVTVMDHFDRALEAKSDEASGKSVLDGIQIVRDELMRTLERFGIRRLDVKAGDEFNPTFHEALMHQQVEGVAPNHVAQQFQPGYTLNDKPLRPAQVSVAR